jgi:DNA-binding IclR family transcriptional regulator
MDASFVRSFFNTYYLAAMYIASATAVSLALSGRLVLAAGAVGLALLATVLRRTILPKMDSLRAQFHESDTTAVPAFRRMHVAAILANLAQLVFIVWSLIATSLEAGAGA